jgi:hypothetical protein
MDYKYLKIEGKYNKSGVIVSQGKFSLRCTDSNEIKNITVYNPSVGFRYSIILTNLF